MKSNHEQINEINDTLKHVKNIIDTDTIVGKEIKTSDGVTIIPISKVIVGYIGGGGEYFDIKVKKNDAPYASGCGTGAYIKPIGFLVVKNDNSVKFIEVDKNIDLNKIMEYAEKIVESLSGGKK